MVGVLGVHILELAQKGTSLWMRSAKSSGCTVLGATRMPILFVNFHSRVAGIVLMIG